MGLGAGQHRNQTHRNLSLQLYWKCTPRFAKPVWIFKGGFGVGEDQGRSPRKYRVSTLTQCHVIPLLMLLFILTEKYFVV